MEIGGRQQAQPRRSVPSDGRHHDKLMGWGLHHGPGVASDGKAACRRRINGKGWARGSRHALIIVTRPRPTYLPT